MDNFSFSDNTVTINDWHSLNHDFENVEARPGILVLSVESPVDFLVGPLDELNGIVITSVDFNDGRMFSLGKQIRLLGFSGTLTAVGDILPDQFPLLLFCGFDNALILNKFPPLETIELDQACSLVKLSGSGTGNPLEVN